MNARKRQARHAFTLIELMIAVAIVGVLALLATLGVRRYMTTARTAEAKSVVGAITRGAVAAYERDSARAEIIPPGADGGYAAHALCASVGSEATGHGPVPAALAQVAGKKYQPRTASGMDFETGTARGGWRCLRFSLSEPIHYQVPLQRAARLPGAGGRPAARVGQLRGRGAGRRGRRRDPERLRARRHGGPCDPAARRGHAGLLVRRAGVTS